MPERPSRAAPQSAVLPSLADLHEDELGNGVRWASEQVELLQQHGDGQRVGAEWREASTK